MFRWRIQLQPWLTPPHKAMMDSGVVPRLTPLLNFSFSCYQVGILSQYQWVIAPDMLHNLHEFTQHRALIQTKVWQQLCYHQIYQPPWSSSYRANCAATMLIEMEFLPLRMVLSIVNWLDLETSQNGLSSWSILSSDSYDHEAGLYYFINPLVLTNNSEFVQLSHCLDHTVLQLQVLHQAKYGDHSRIVRVVDMSRMNLAPCNSILLLDDRWPWRLGHSPEHHWSNLCHGKPMFKGTSTNEDLTSWGKLLLKHGRMSGTWAGISNR